MAMAAKEELFRPSPREPSRYGSVGGASRSKLKEMPHMKMINRRVVLLACCLAVCLTTLVWRMPTSVSADTTVTICGTVTAFTAATATSPGGVVICGAPLVVAPGGAHHCPR